MATNCKLLINELFHHKIDVCQSYIHTWMCSYNYTYDYHATITCTNANLTWGNKTIIH
jgi:hypothetical protein